MVPSSHRSMIYNKLLLSLNVHLSNEATGNLLAQVHHDNLKHVHLAHLSSECNSPETALSVIKEILEQNGIQLDMCVAPQDKISRPILF